MNTATNSIYAAILIIGVAGSASAQNFMTQKELLATIPGATLYGISNTDGKTQWAQAYGKGRKKGKIAGNFGGDKYESKWFVKGDMWCEDWGSGTGCWQMVRAGEKELQPYKDGNPLKNPWKIK